ncbi:MAG: L-iditol 2-dehydrogenase [Thermomicrobiales bacterium]
MKLDARTAIVTGGGSGIGRAICLRYASEGASVVVADLQLDAAQAVTAEITAAGGKALPVGVDVRKQDQVAEMIDITVETYGQVNILVNNAGVGKIIPFFETTEADWNLMFDVNCKGLLWCSQAAAKQMVDQAQGGKIINLASQAGRRGEALVLAYCASKAAVISMTQSMALALAPHKINVNAIAPGIVDTPFWVEVDKQLARLLNMEVGEPKRTFTKSIPMGRIEQPEDLTGAAVFLASSDSDYVTQQCLNVDGGNWPS